MRCVSKHPVPYALAASLPALESDERTAVSAPACVHPRIDGNAQHACKVDAHHMIRAARAVGGPASADIVHVPVDLDAHTLMVSFAGTTHRGDT